MPCQRTPKCRWGAGDPARGPAQPKALPFVNVLPDLHLNLRKVHVLGGKLLPVVDHHQVSLIKHGPSDDDDAIVCGQHRRSRPRVEVRPAMDACQLTIERAGECRMNRSLRTAPGERKSPFHNGSSITLA